MLKLRCLLVMILALGLQACASREPVPEILAPDNPDTMTSANTADGRPAWAPRPLTSMPANSLIGIMTVLDNEVVHVESGLGSGSVQVLKPGFDLPGYTADTLRKTIFTKTRYRALFVPPSARLMADKAVWQKTWNDKTQTFDNKWQQEFDAVIRQNSLQMLIVISAPPVDDGFIGSRAKLQGSGFLSRGIVGKKQTAAFSSVHYYRILGTPGKLLFPARAPDDRLYVELPNFPESIPDPVPKPIQDAIERGVRSLLDQKADAFVTMMNKPG